MSICVSLRLLGNKITKTKKITNPKKFVNLKNISKTFQTNKFNYNVKLFMLKTIETHIKLNYLDTM